MKLITLLCSSGVSRCLLARRPEWPKLGPHRPSSSRMRRNVGRCRADVCRTGSNLGQRRSKSGHNWSNRAASDPTVAESGRFGSRAAEVGPTSAPNLADFGNAAPPKLAKCCARLRPTSTASGHISKCGSEDKHGHRSGTMIEQRNIMRVVRRSALSRSVPLRALLLLAPCGGAASASLAQVWSGVFEIRAGHGPSILGV